MAFSCRAYGGSNRDLCSVDSDCDSGRCASFQCTEGDVNDPCIFHSDCKQDENRCTGMIGSRLCKARLDNGSSCIENAECKSKKCIFAVCRSKGDTNDPCLLGSDCNSGRCEYLKCKSRLGKGSWCNEDSDCDSGRCRFKFTGSKCD